MNTTSHEHALKSARDAFVWTRLLSTPFWALLNILPIILYKDLHISEMQVTIIIILKPLSSLFAPYWSSSIYERQDRLKSNLVWANLLRYLPFLFIPWLNSSWLIILAFAIYMVLSRGAIPAWMEIFKKHIPETKREQVFAYGSAIDYLGSALLPIMLGILLDDYAHSWRWLFPITAALGIFSTVFLYKIPSLPNLTHVMAPLNLSIKEQLLKPWKQSWQILKKHTDFTSFQIAFMLGGGGLMVMQPALPMFFVDVLELSYTKMVLAIAVCKGIGYAATSPVWVRFFKTLSIFNFSSFVTLLAAVFPFFLIGAQYHIGLLYAAYIIYGTMQAGSEMCWHMSGPQFAKNEDSSPYSSTNVLTVGVRGCFFPLFGSMLYEVTNSTTVMLLGSFLCLLAYRHLVNYNKAQQLSET